MATFAAARHEREPLETHGAGGPALHVLSAIRLPTRKRQIARQHHAAAFIPFCQEREEHLHLFSAVLDISNIVKNHYLISRNLLEKTAQLQITLGGQEILNYQTATCEHHPPSRADHFLAQRARDMRFPSAWIS